MKERKTPILLAILWIVNFVFISGSLLLAQEEDGFRIKTKSGEISLKAGDEVVIQTVSGDEITGTVTGSTEQHLLLASKYGELKLNLETIKEINVLRKMGDKSGQSGWRFRDPLSTRSFFSATGQTLQKGEKSFENYYLFFNAFNYGITNHLQMNAGMSLFPSKNFIKNNVYMAGAKFKIYDGGSFRIAAGGQFMSLPFVKEIDASFIYPYGVVGVGNPDNAQLNVSYGRLFFVSGDTEDKDINSFINVNAQWRVSNYLKLVGEVMYPLDAKDIDGVPYVWGIRFMTKNIGVDFGFWNSTESKIFPGIPMISFSYNWK